MRLRWRTLVVAAHLAPLGAIAMEHRIAGDQLILSGALDGNELVLFKDLEANRQLESVRTVVLRNSPGGNAWTAMRVGEFVRERGLRTAVSGYCFGGCAMIFLGGRERHFTNDRPERQTQINFTATYNSQDDALRMTKGTQNETMTEIGRGWLRKHSDGKLSEEMLDRIGRLQQNQFIHFFAIPAVPAPGQSHAVYCVREGEGSRTRCDPIRGTDALREGLITSTEFLRSRDLEATPAK